MIETKGTAPTRRWQPGPESGCGGPRRYQVLLHNDDYTTMEFVVMILMTVFHTSESEAVRTMMQVHQQGVGVAGVYSCEVAETKVAKVCAAGPPERVSPALHHGAGNDMIIAKELQVAFSVAVQEALRRRHDLVSLEHLLFALTGDARGSEILEHCGADVEELRGELEAYLEEHGGGARGRRVRAGADRGRDPGAAARRRPRASARARRRSTPATCWRPCTRRTRAHARLPAPGPGGGAAGRPQLHLPRRQQTSSKAAGPPGGAGRGREEEAGDGAPARHKDPLAAFTTDLVARAAAGRIDPLIGRAEELERTIQVLCRRRKNNPVFVGEAGVGKTAMAEGLALAIHARGGARDAGRTPRSTPWTWGR